MLKAILSKGWKWITILLNALLMIACNLIETISPYDLTITRISIIETRIKAYWKVHAQLPSHLSDLPILEGRDNNTTDGWGKNINYKTIGRSTVTLSSFGADGTFDGTDANQDIIVTFNVNETN